MRILVTGGTGLAGCHTTAALRADGHEVRLLVRDPARIAHALGPLGIERIEHVVGDVTHRAAVESALDGCDAVVHSAALFTLDRRRAAEVQLTNEVGTELVLGTATRLGLDPIVHVSSVAALFPPDGPTLTPDTSVKRPRDMYASSKANAERIARRLQEQGKPVTIVYPGSIWGPHDPTLGDGIRAILDYIRWGLLPDTPGGMPMIDVRDLAALQVAAMQPGRGPRRFMAGGHFLRFAELGEILTRLTGRRFWAPKAPGVVLRAIGRTSDVARRLLGVELAPSHEAMITLIRGVPCDDSRTRAELGVKARSPEETLRDTLRWMYERGVVSARDIGRLAD
ncbi:MAG: NAD-dependent epimerase/dehydratase family protein [Myxococcales bacterium]|nr:NAD-dependent epimerase/dehydratase family protein [Myxococcales bacterium]